MTGIEFLRRPKVSSHITVPIKSIKSEVSHATCGRHPFPMRGATPPKKRRVALKIQMCVYVLLRAALLQTAFQAFSSVTAVSVHNVKKKQTNNHCEDLCQSDSSHRSDDTHQLSN